MSEPQNLFYNEKCVPLGWHLPISCTSVPWQPPFYSLRVWLLGSHIQVTSCSVCPLVTGWFHSAVSYMLSQMIRFPPVLWLSWIILHCIYTPHFLYPFINGHLGGFHIHATLNVGCRYLFEILMSFFGIYTQKRDFWVIWLFHFLFFEENTHRAFHSGTPIYVPTNSVQEILKWPPRPCMFWDLPAHSTSTYFTSPHLTSPHLISPHLHETQGSGHMSGLPSCLDISIPLTWLSLQSCLSLPLTFLLSILLLYTLPSGYFSQCMYRLVFCGCFYILNNTRTLLNLSLSRRTRTVCIDPHSTVSESHTAPGPLWVLSKYLLILNENVNLFWQREERILKWVFLLKIPF